jgi:hypothetical protein
MNPASKIIKAQVLHGWRLGRKPKIIHHTINFVNPIENQISIHVIFYKITLALYKNTKF